MKKGLQIKKLLVTYLMPKFEGFFLCPVHQLSTRFYENTLCGFYIALNSQRESAIDLLEPHPHLDLTAYLVDNGRGLSGAWEQLPGQLPMYAGV